MTIGQIDFLQIDRSALGKNIDPKLHKRCIEQKLSFIEKPNLPIYDKIRQYMQDVQNLSFTEDPNYNKLKGYLKNLMGGLEEYLAKIRQQIYTRVYERLYYKNLAEVTNVVAMKKRRQLEEKITALLLTSLQKKVQQRATKQSIEKMNK